MIWTRDVSRDRKGEEKNLLRTCKGTLTSSSHWRCTSWDFLWKKASSPLPSTTPAVFESLLPLFTKTLACFIFLQANGLLSLGRAIQVCLNPYPGLSFLLRPLVRLFVMLMHQEVLHSTSCPPCLRAFFKTCSRCVWHQVSSSLGLPKWETLLQVSFASSQKESRCQFFSSFVFKASLLLGLWYFRNRYSNNN